MENSNTTTSNKNRKHVGFNQNSNNYSNGETTEQQVGNNDNDDDPLSFIPRVNEFGDGNSNHHDDSENEEENFDNKNNNNSPGKFSSLDNTIDSQDHATRNLLKKIMASQDEFDTQDNISSSSPSAAGSPKTMMLKNKQKVENNSNNNNINSSKQSGGDSAKAAQRIRLSIDDLRDIKTICEEFGEIELDDFLCHIGPIARRQNRNITDRDLSLLFEFIDANDSKGVDWEEISMFLIRNDEMEEKRLSAAEVTKYGTVESSTHATLPQFDTQLRMLHHKFPVNKIIVHPRLPLVFSASLREVKIWKTDMIRHVRTPFVNSKHDIVSSISLCPAWDDSIIVTCFDHTVAIYGAQSGDLSQLFVSERGGSSMGRRADRSGTGKRTVTREIFSVPWTEQEARQLRSDLGGKAALCGALASHDPLLGHLNPPRVEEATVLYDLSYVNPKQSSLLPPHLSRRTAYPTCAEVFVSPMTATHKLAVGLSTGHVQIYDIEACRRVDGSSPVGVRCEAVIKMHEGAVRNLRASASLGTLMSSGGEDGLIQLRNLERVDLTHPTCTLGNGLPIIDSRYASAHGNTKSTLHERDTARVGHSHGIVVVDVHEKHRLLASCAESENDVLLWSPFIVKPLAKLECSKRAACLSVSFNQAEPHLVCLSGDGQVRIFDVRSLRCLQQFDSSVQSITRYSKEKIEDCFPVDKSQRPFVCAADSHGCRVLTGTNELYAFDVISSDRKDLVEGHATAILGNNVVNRSDLNFLATFDKRDVCLWDNNGELVVRWDQSAAGNANAAGGDNGSSSEAAKSSDDSKEQLATSAASAAAHDLEGGLTGAVASMNKRSDLVVGCMDSNERRLFLALSDGRVEVVNMMNGYPLKKLAPPDALELEKLKHRREEEQKEREEAYQLYQQQQQQQQQQNEKNSLTGMNASSSLCSPARAASPDEIRKRESYKKLLASLESVTHASKDIDKNEKEIAKEAERRNRLGLADGKNSRSLLSEADRIKAARAALGDVTAIAYGDQSIPREGGLCAVTYSTGYAALYADEPGAPLFPQRVLRARDPIYSVTVFPPSFVALGLTGKIAVHTLEEVGDRLTFLEPLGRDVIARSTLHAAIVPGPLLTDPRNSSTLTLCLPTGEDTNNINLKDKAAPLQPHTPHSNSNVANLLQRHRSNASSTSSGIQNFASVLDQGHSSVEAGLAKFTQDRHHMMTIVECLVAVHIGRSEPTLISATGAGTLHVWDIRRQIECQRFLASVAFGEAVTTMSLHPFTHDQLAIGDSCGYITIFDVSHLGARETVDIGAKSILLGNNVRDQFKVVSRFRAHTSAVASLSLASGEYVVSAASDTIAMRFALDGTFLRSFGRYFGKEGLLSPTRWIGINHHAAALATFDAVRARVIAKILDTLGPMTKEDIIAQCYFVPGSASANAIARAEKLYTPKELAEVNLRVRKDEMNQIVYRQPPPRSPFFSMVYYEDITHERMIERILKMMVDQTPLTGSTATGATSNGQSKNNNKKEVNSNNNNNPAGAANTASNNNNTGSLSLHSTPLIPPKLHFNRENLTYFRAAKQHGHQPLPTYAAKKSVVEFNLPVDNHNDSNDQEEDGGINNTSGSLATTNTKIGNFSKQEDRPTTKGSITSTILSHDDDNEDAFAFDTNNQTTNDNNNNNSNINNISKKKKKTSKSPPSGSPIKNLDSANFLTTIGGNSALNTSGTLANGREASNSSSSPMSGKDKSLFDVNAIVQRSGFFEESDDEDGPLRKPVPPRHVTKLNKPSDVGTLAQSLLIDDPTRFMTLAPLTEEQQLKKNREKLLFGSERAKRTFEFATKECIQNASELIEENRRSEAEKRRRQKEKLRMIRAVSSASFGENGSIIEVVEHDDYGFDDDDDDGYQSRNKNRTDSAVKKSGADGVVPGLDLNRILDNSDSLTLEKLEKEKELARKRQHLQQIGGVTGAAGGLGGKKSHLAQTARVRGEKVKSSSSSTPRDQNNNSTAVPQIRLARGEGLEIATQWKHFLETDDQFEMQSGVTPRPVWLRDAVRVKPVDLFSYTGLTGSFDMNLHLKEEKKREMLRRKELGLVNIGGSENDDEDIDDEGNEDDNVSPGSSFSQQQQRKKKRTGSSSPNSKRGSGFLVNVGSNKQRILNNNNNNDNPEGSPNSIYSNKASTGRSMFRSFRRHNFSSHLLDTADRRNMKRNPLDGPTGGVFFTEVTKPEKTYEAIGSLPPPSAANNNTNTLIKIPKKPKNGKSAFDETANDDLFGDESGEHRNIDNHEGVLSDSPLDPSETHLDAIPEKINLPFSKLSRLLQEAQQRKEELEEQLRLEKAEAENEIERKQQRHRNRKNKNDNNSSSRRKSLSDGLKSQHNNNNNNDNDDDDDDDATTTVGTDWDGNTSEYTSGGEDDDDDDDEDNSDDGDEDGSSTNVSGGRRRARSGASRSSRGSGSRRSNTNNSKKRNSRNNKKRSNKNKKKKDDDRHYSKDGWSAKIRQLRDGELRIQATNPWAGIIPSEAFFPPKDNAHVLANILSKWHVEKVEKEKPPAAGLQGVSAAVLSSSALKDGFGNTKNPSPANNLKGMAGRRALDEREIIKDWSKFNREGPTRSGVGIVQQQVQLPK